MSNKKNENVINWDDYFMSLAVLSSKRSKDPNTQVGSVIINEMNHIVGIGYNGFPNNCSDDELSWSRDNTDPLENKYLYVVHSEVNAIMNSNNSVKNCKMYVTMFPCNECAKIIIQSEIKEIIYISDKYHKTTSIIASKRMLDMANIKYRQFKCNNKSKIIIDFKSFK